MKILVAFYIDEEFSEYILCEDRREYSELTSDMSEWADLVKNGKDVDLFSFINRKHNKYGVPSYTHYTSAFTFEELGIQDGEVFKLREFYVTTK